MGGGSVVISLRETTFRHKEDISPMVERLKLVVSLPLS